MNKVDKLRKKLSRYTTVGIDSCIFIYLFENHPLFAPVCAEIIDLLQDGKLEGFFAPIVLSEVLTAPMKSNQVEQVFQLDQTMRNIPNLFFAPIDPGEARLAGYFKATYNYKLPDCLHLASTVSAGAQLFITNDQQLKSIRTPEVLCLSDYV